MNRKKYYFAVAVTAFFGLLMSFLLLPSRTDTALMFFYDKQFEKSYEHYRRLYEKGDHSVKVVIPLVNLLLEYAQIEMALDLMEEYASENPDSVDALKYLASVYKKSNRTYEYLRTLEDIYVLQPNVEVLREKEKNYGYVGDHESEVEALEVIVNRYRPKKGEYLELAYQYAATGDKQKAMETIQSFLKTVSLPMLDEATAYFVVDLLSAQKQREQALMVAKDYYAAHSRQGVALGMISAFQSGQLYQEALTFMDQLPAEERQKPLMLAAKVHLYLSKEDPDQAFQLLKNYLNTGIMPPALYPDLIALAIEYHDIEVLKNAISKTLLEDIPIKLLIKVLYTAAISGNDEMLASFMEMLPQDFVETHQGLSVSLAIVDPSLSIGEKTFLLPFYPLDAISNHQLAILAKMMTTFGSSPATMLLLDHIESLEGIPYGELSELSQLYIDHQMSDRGWELIQSAKEKEPEIQEYQRFWLIMASATDRQDLIEEWLGKSDQVNSDLLRDLFYAAFNQKHASLSMLLANRLHKLRPTNENEKILAEALMLNGYTEWAHEITRELLGKGYDVAELYVNTLIVLADEKPEYADQLENAVQGFVRENISSEQALRNLGWLLHEHQKKALAATVFAQLANGKEIDDPDMNALLWMWGKEINNDQRQWILSHAMAAQGANKAKWIQYFLDVEQPELSMQVVHKEDLDEEAIADKYIEALVMAKQEDELKEVIAYVIPQESRLPRLKKLGALAYGQGLRAIAESVFVRVLNQDPKDQEALFALGEIYYAQGDYSCAIPYLKKVENSFLANYYLAEIFQIKGFLGYARSYYNCAHRLFCRMECPTDDQLAVQAVILYRLGYYAQALGIFQTLLTKQPDNQYWQADYANILIDLNCLTQARCVLWTPSRNEPIESLELARVRYYGAALCYFQALRLSNQLLCKYPESARVRGERSSLEWNLKRWRKAFCYNRQARALDPDNEIYCLSQNEILRTHRPELMIAGEYRVTGVNQKERYGYLSYRYPINAANQLLLRLDFDDIDVENYVNVNTGILEDCKADRLKGELAWVHRFWCGGVLTPSLYFSESNFGAGVHYLQPDLRGATILAIEYNRPNWDFTQTIIDEGTRDMVAIKRTQPIFPQFETSFGAGLNRYSLEGIGEAATSWSLEANATYLLSKGNCLRRVLGAEGVVSFNYYLDAEYKLHVKEKLGPLDQPYDPLPLVSRETHAGFVYLAKRFSKCLAIDGYGGMSYDREAGGSAVPIWGSQVFFGNLDRFHGRFEYSHSTSTEFSNESVDRYLLDFRWLW